MSLIGDDCVFFYTTSCKKGDRCQYRHCEEALGSVVVCPSWLDGGCFMPHCPYRHANIESSAPSWDEYGHYGHHGAGVQSGRSSLVSVPLVPGGDGPLTTEPYPADQFYPRADSYPPGPPFYPPGEPAYIEPVSQAPVIITQRRDDHLFPPQVQPVVVHLGANADSSDSEESDCPTNLTTIRRVDTDRNTDEVESSRMVVPREAIPVSDEPLAPERRVQEAMEPGVRDRKPSDDEEHAGNDGSANEEEEEEVGTEDESGGNEDEVEEEQGGSGEEEEEAADQENGSDAESEESRTSGSASQSSQPQLQLEPELDLFDEDDTAILGVVEHTPISVKRNRKQESRRRRSSGGKSESRQERRERRRQNKKISPAPARSPAKNTAKQTKTDETESKKSAEKKAEESKEPVDVMSLEEIMRQKALQSMIERRKQKEAEKKGDNPEKKSKSPETAQVSSPRRPDREPRRRSVDRDLDRSRRRSPPGARRWSPTPADQRWRPRHRRMYESDWRRYDDPYDPRNVEARNLSLLQAQSDLMEKMARLASGANQLLSERDLKRQQKLLTRQLRQLTKNLHKGDSDSASRSSSCSSYSSSSSGERRRRRKHKSKRSKKSKKSKRSRRQSVERSDNEMEAVAEVEDQADEHHGNGVMRSPVQIPLEEDDSVEMEEVERPITPKWPIPRAKMVIKIDENSGDLNVSGSDLIQSKAEDSGRSAEVKVVPGRKIQLKKSSTVSTLQADEEVAKRKQAIASRLAAKRADDEATKLMLQKIRETAMKDARKVVKAGTTIPSVLSKSVEDIKQIADQSEATTTVQSARLVTLPKVNKPQRISPPVMDDMESEATSDGGNKRRIVRRPPVKVYVPPAAKRAEGDVRAQLDKIKEAKASTITRSLTPEPVSSSVSDPSARRATVADVRTTVPATAPKQADSGTKFELGVKTFADIMREKRERKARDLEEKKRLGQNSGQNAESVTNKPKLNRPSVLDRLSLPKSDTISTPKPTSTVAPLSSARRTIQQYDDDWLGETSVSPQEGLLRDTKRSPSASGNIVPIKRVRTEPAKLNTLTMETNVLKSDTPVISDVKKSVISTKQEVKHVETICPLSVEPAEDFDDLLLEDEDVAVAVEEENLPVAVEADDGPMSAVVETRAQRPVSIDFSSEPTKISDRVRSTSTTHSDSRAEFEELDMLLADVDETKTRVKPSVQQQDDDDALLMELDQLLS